MEDHKPEPAARPSLRERKKRAMRAAIERAAVELFEVNGFDGTSVEEIADRAEVSPSTLFRYFGSKEEVLFSREPEIQEALLAALREREDRGRSIAALLPAFVTFAARYDRSDDRLAKRQQSVISGAPALRARVAVAELAWERAIAGELAREAGEDQTSLESEALAAVAMGMFSVAIRRWRSSGNPRPLAELIHDAFVEAARRCDPAPEPRPGASEASSEVPVARPAAPPVAKGPTGPPATRTARAGAGRSRSRTSNRSTRGAK